MKAPNKINVPILNGKLFGIIKEDGGRFRDCDGHVEYLRKDALLEWLKSERKKCESRDTELGQRINTFTDVIDKLKSM